MLIPAARERLEDALELGLQHREVAVHDRLLVAAGENGQVFTPMELPAETPCIFVRGRR